MGWVAEGDPVPEAERAALAARDAKVRATIIDRDPANVLAVRALGQEFTDELLTITERLPRPYGSGSSSSLSGGSTSGYPGYPERPFGYQSIHLGKWHLGGGRGARTAPGDPLAQGFHDNIGGDARGNPGGVQFADDEGRFPLPGLERAGEPGVTFERGPIPYRVDVSMTWRSQGESRSRGFSVLIPREVPFGTRLRTLIVN